MEKTIKWEVGKGYITVNYDGEGNGEIHISSDPNVSWEERSQHITVTTSGNPSLYVTIIVRQSRGDIDGGYSFTEDSEYYEIIDGESATTGEVYEKVINCFGAEETS